ncbi:hypothetical protein NC796_05600 [Aliifodinibius sp. S!AR15-10]|uniref:hypothetical protein n=1 Tax=Aliifodinibius sp. S!AR15-10 TaxID=2950437 RepID=UPI002858B003|nr:hypothetical protein [Aliifodinibius sp. S!AR15-10]MDR8390603.1 hypothetical protein [Aliifodinibius sp. S!AR15-10]
MDDTKTLLLTIQSFPDQVSLKKPLEVEISLKNSGDDRVLVNTRMAVGYEDSISRELYLELERVDQPEKLDYIEYDINRDFSPSSDYRWLQPGETITTSFDLLNYYHLTQPGTYRLSAFYQANEDLADTPEDIYPFTVKSEPVVVDIVTHQVENSN